MSDLKNRVIIVQKDEHENKKGPHLSWSIYGKGINHFKWWLLGGSLVFGILGFVGAKFIYNPAKETLTTTITPALALNEDGTAYLDGSVYRATDLISKDNIEAVLAQNSSYKYTYDKLMEKNTFTISPTEKTELVDGVSTTVKTYSTYILTTKPGVFKTTNEARNFIKSLINYEIERSKTAISSFSFSTCLPDSISFNSLSFDRMVEKLNSQYENLVDDYTSMVTKIGSNTIINNKTLSSYYSDYVDNYSNNQFNIISGQLVTNKFVNISNKEEAKQKIYEYEDLKASYEKRFISLASTLNTDTALLDKLIQINSGKDGISEQIAVQITELTDQIKELQLEQSNMISELTQIGYNCTIDNNNNVTITKSTDTNNYLYKLNEYISSSSDETDWSKGCIAYKKTLLNFYTYLTNDTKTASSLYRTIYSSSQRNTIEVKESNNGTLSGHISNMLVAVIFLILGYVILSLSFAITEMNLQYNKTLEANSNVIQDAVIDSPKNINDEQK